MRLIAVFFFGRSPSLNVDFYRPTIERMNEFAPQHSRLFKEARHSPFGEHHRFLGDKALTVLLEQMILVSSPKKPFVLTAKLTARRQAVIAQYEPEIDGLYEAVDETTRAVKSSPGKWTERTSLEFARNLIGSVLKHPVKDDDDIFQHSCDRSDPSAFDLDSSR